MEGTSSDLMFDKATSRVIDYLDDDKDPRIMIDFNPCLVAAKNTENAWVGWKYIDSRGVTNTIAHDNKYGWQYIFDDDYVDTGAPNTGALRNTHLNLYAVYTEGYYEVVFDGGVNNETNGEAPNGDGVIVDSDRRYGVMAIMKDQTYKDCLYYIPTAKHTENGVLYCSVGWKHSKTAHIENHDHLIDCTSWNEGEKYQHGADSIIYAHYKYVATDLQQQVFNSEGYLVTYYANNKYAHMNGGTYNNAYFDPDQNIGGTMYYIYYRPTDANGNYLPYSNGMSYITYNGTNYPVVCEPLFAYDPAEDYMHAFKYTPTTHEEYICDFNINTEYYKQMLVEKGVVIAKEPKRYTMYVGEGAHLVLPQTVCDPEGNTDADPIYDDETQTYRNQEIINGNTFYTDFNGKNFTITRNREKNYYGEEISRWPTMYIYTEATTLETYHAASSVYFPEAKDLKMGLLPYVDNAGKTEPYDVHNYETAFPYASKGLYFHAPYSTVNGQDYKLYMDFNTNSYNSNYIVYGSGLRLTYPNSRGTINPAFTEQYAYYQQWDYSIEYNANYPDNAVRDSEGYTGGDSVYTMISPFETFVAYNDKLFTSENYVITSWNTMPDGSGQSIAINESMNPLTAMCLFMEPGITLYAQWEPVVNFTLVEGGEGAGTFAKLTYTNAYSGEVTTINVKETKTVKCRYGTAVSVTNVSAASEYEFAYFTWNNMFGNGSVDLKYTADRILTNKPDYTFTIVNHSAMTVQFVPTDSTNGFVIDRNNKLLRSDSDPWRLHVVSPSRTHLGTAGHRSLTNIQYELYTNSNNYSVDVSNSTYTALNKKHTLAYDSVITLMTDPVKNGNHFVGWQINDKFVSYDLVYKYRVSSNVTIKALYTGVATPSIVCTYENSSAAADTLIAYRSAPEGYTLLESGFILKNNNTETTFEELSADNSAYRLVTTDTNKDGAFKVILKGGQYWGYAYAIYSKPDGSIETCNTEWLSV